ncbi:hypothetical protein [Desulfothermobacter acidiphilus]|uniref:hypothetical protein n=1 Tax=Desulfothermobacter acidiphilus TaxID=1938353 RepID=UPI003F8C7479
MADLSYGELPAMKGYIMQKNKKNEKAVHVFLDTNVLIFFLKHNVFFKYTAYPFPIKFVILEKCWNELKNGYKRHFLNVQTICECVSKWKKAEQKGQEDKYTGDHTKEIARQIIFKILDILNLSSEEVADLKRALHRYDLNFEFGIAEEYQGTSLPEMETVFSLPSQDREARDILRMKQFYALTKSYLRDFYKDLEIIRKRAGIEMIYEERLFRKIMERSILLEDTYLPPEDTDIVFAALASGCDIFATNDKDLLKKLLTLGLNHSLELVRVNAVSPRSPEEVLGALKELDAALEEYQHKYAVHEDEL